MTEDGKKKRSLLELVLSCTQGTITKSEFGRIMHDPTATEEEIARALKEYQVAEGYENLPD